MGDLEFDECEYRAAELRELLRNWNGTGADTIRATVSDAADTLEKANEAVSSWPEWAEKLLRLLESWGAEYEYDDDINLPDELAEWLHHYASDLKRTAAARRGATAP